MNKLKKGLLLWGLIPSLLMAPGCSFFNTDQGVMIEDVIADVGDDGTTTVTITFIDDAMQPIVFKIPKGEKGDSGQTGNGISKIETTANADGTTTLTFSFTDEDVDPVSVEIPHGVGISDITQEPLTDGDGINIVVSTSDGKEYRFPVYNGEDGVGIKGVTQTTDEEGNISIVISYTDPSWPDTTISIPYKNGEDGRGIESITSSTIDQTVTLHINYTDGTSDDVDFALPHTTSWLYGPRTPNSTDVRRAMEGDFFFDTANFVIYQFNGVAFTRLFDFKEDSTSDIQTTVIFDPCGGEYVYPSVNFTGSITTVKGSYIPLESIPVASLEGYEFTGWYTTKGENVNGGQLTDLTPIMSDLTVYAHYVTAEKA